MDVLRDRSVPVRVYWPADAAGPQPVVLFSHGLGGSRDACAYLGTHWASWGYVSVHMQHAGSDRAIWQDVPPAQRLAAMRRAKGDLPAAMSRPRDVSFILDRLESQAGQGRSDDVPFADVLDLKRVGIAGHSFGAWTALVSSGRTLGRRRRRLDLRDDRIDACLAMSAPAKSVRHDAPSYRDYTVATLHMTGTLDTSPISDVTPAQRRVPFDCIRDADGYLVVFRGGDHQVFSGQRWRDHHLADRDRVIQPLIRATSTALWDAYLRDEHAARSWLGGGGAKAALADEGTWEVYRPSIDRP